MLDDSTIEFIGRRPIVYGRVVSNIFTFSRVFASLWFWNFGVFAFFVFVDRTDQKSKSWFIIDFRWVERWLGEWMSVNHGVQSERQPIRYQSLTVISSRSINHSASHHTNAFNSNECETHNFYFCAENKHCVHCGPNPLVFSWTEYGTVDQFVCNSIACVRMSSVCAFRFEIYFINNNFVYKHGTSTVVHNSKTDRASNWIAREPFY